MRRALTQYDATNGASLWPWREPRPGSREWPGLPMIRSRRSMGFSCRTNSVRAGRICQTQSDLFIADFGGSRGLSPVSLHTTVCSIDAGESAQADAEGATAPETLRPKGPFQHKAMTLESGAQASAEGITISGKRTEGASKPQAAMACSIQCWIAWESPTDARQP